eukprot:scaffold148_cov341-Pavlova_lutheri.AAC.32
MVVNQWTLVLKSKLSITMVLTNSSSPPGQTISCMVPPKSVLGFNPASSPVAKNGGLHIVKATFSPGSSADRRMDSPST